MSQAARQVPAPKPKRRPKWPPLAYVVEVEPCDPDPAAARKVLDWIRARVR